MKAIVWYSVVVLATNTFLVILWQLRQAIVLFLLSLTIAAAFRPLIDYFYSRKFPRKLALFSSYFLVLVSISGMIYLTSEPLFRELGGATNQIAIGYENLKTMWHQAGTPFQRILAEQLPSGQAMFGTAGISGADSGFFQALLGITTNTLVFFGKLALILILSLYWNADSNHFERLLLSLIPVEQRPSVRGIWKGIENSVGAYVRSEIVQSLLAAVFLWFGYRLFSLNYPLLLALIGALAWLIPWFGGLIAIIPVLLVGFASNPILGVLASLYSLLVLFILEWVVEPRIFPKLNYSSVILVIVILVLADAYGLVGLILAPLVSAGAQIVFQYVGARRKVGGWMTQPDEVDKSDMDALEMRLKQIREEAISMREAPPRPEISSLVDRLDSLMGRMRVFIK